MKKLSLLLFAFLMTTVMIAQTAQLQIIHNSASPTVDIWVNGDKFRDSVAYRTATEFIDVPAGVDLEVGVAPYPSNDVSDIIATVTINLNADEAYVAMARGIVGDMNTPFTIDLIENARTQASQLPNFDFLIAHGSTDAPAVDVLARNVGTLADDLSYGETTDYIEVLASNYIIDVVNPDNNELIVASYEAQLVGAPSLAAVVFASGFLNPTNPDDPAFGLFAAFPDGTVLELPGITNEARLQVIHNSPSPTVDIWINGSKALDSVAFRTATEFLTLPAGVELEIGVAPYPSNDASEIIATFNFILTPQQLFVAVATGIVGDMTNPFFLLGYTPAQVQATDPANVDLAIFHGSTDAPPVNVDARGVGSLVENLEYGEFTPYQSVPADDYVLDIRPSSAPDNIVASYEAPLSGLAGGAAVVFASGFLNPGMDEPAFGLFAALPDGTVIELPATTAEAQLQIIHNSPSPTVDIWVNGNKALDSLTYRSATQFLTLPAGANLNVGVAPSPSTSEADIIYDVDVTLQPNEAYVAIATGIVGDTTAPFEVVLVDDIRLSSNDPNNVDFFVFHGSTDAPAVDALARGVATLADDLAYGEATDYLEVPAADYIVDITPADNNDILVKSYAAPLTTGRGFSAVVLASGFLNPADTTQPDFGLFVVLPNGLFIQLPELENVANVQLLHNSPTPVVDIYVNDVLALDSVPFRAATSMDSIPAGIPFTFGIAPYPSTDTSDVIAEFEVTFSPDESYILVANGIVGDTSTPFDLIEINDVALEAGSDDDFAVGILHGSPDAPAVNATLRGVGPAVTDLEFGEFTDYADIPAADYIIDLAASAEPSNVLLSYQAPLSTLGGESGLLFASGLLADPGTDAPFGLFLLLTDGTVIELPRETTQSRNYMDFDTKLFPSVTQRNPVQISWSAQGSTTFNLTVVDQTGRVVQNKRINSNSDIIQEEINVEGLPSGSYQVVISNGESFDSKSFVVQ